MALNQLFSSIEIFSLYDLDDRILAEVEDLKKNNVKVLSRRDIENFLWDDEIIEKLYTNQQHPEKLSQALDKRRNF